MRLSALVMPLAASVFVWLGPSASAEIFAPGQDVPGVVGQVFGWERGDQGSTYNAWDRFEAVLEDGFIGTPFTDDTPDIEPQFGPAGSISVSPGALGVGSGNAYSGAVALSFSAIAPSGTLADNTRIVAQFQTGGTEMDYDNIFLSADLDNPGTIAPDLLIETGRLALGGFGGDRVTFLALWDLAESQDAYRLDFAAAVPNLSLQEFHLDTFTSASAFTTPAAIPEPASLTLLAIGAVLINVRRRRSTNAR